MANRLDDNSPTSRLDMRVPLATLQKFKQYCKDRGTTVSEVLREFMEKCIRK